MIDDFDPDGGEARGGSLSDGEDQPTSDLDEPDALNWASMGIWTDVAVRSRPEILRQTISTLNQTLADEERDRLATRRRYRLALIAVIALAVTAIAIGALLVGDHTAGRRSALVIALGGLLAIASILIGALLSARFKLQGDERGIDLTRTVLRHETDYMRRIGETEH